MERPWEPKWQYHLPISSWLKLKHDAYTTERNQATLKEWRRYIDDIFSLWDSHEKDVDQFIEQANKFHPTIKFHGFEISENEITFLDTVVFKGERNQAKRMETIY